MRVNPENPNNRQVVPSIVNPDAAAWKLPGGVKDRRTNKHDRRLLTPKGEIIVEVPFTEGQARALLAWFDHGTLVNTEASADLQLAQGAAGLLRAALEYSVAQVLGSGLTSGQRQGWIDTGLIEEPFDAHVERARELALDESIAESIES